LTLVLLSRLFPWRQALTIVKPHTFIRWHRQGFRLASITSLPAESRTATEIVA
jgi:hypothetical protein